VRLRRPSPLRVIVYLLILGLYLPLLIVILYSFNSGSNLSWPIQGLSLRWFRNIFSDSVFSTAVRTSFEVSAVVAVISVLVATTGALVFTRRRTRWTRSLQTASLLPAMMPPLFIAIALFTTMDDLNIQPGLLTIILGQLVVTLPFTVVIATARLQRFEVELEAAARDLGAGAWMTIRRVTARIILPTLLGAGLLAFAFSFDEVLITNFTSGTDTTVPLYIYSKLHRSVDPSVNAVAALLIVVPWIALGFATLFLRRGGGLSGRALARGA